MTHPHLSTTAIGIVLTVVAVGFYGLIVLYGAWIDGKRQKARDKGEHPVTGRIKAREDEDV
jgi:hypothetical protein